MLMVGVEKLLAVGHMTSCLPAIKTGAAMEDHHSLEKFLRDRREEEGEQEELNLLSHSDSPAYQRVAYGTVKLYAIVTDRTSHLYDGRTP